MEVIQPNASPQQTFSLSSIKDIDQARAMVVAQLVERLLPIPEVRSSNPVIGKNLCKY